MKEDVSVCVCGVQRCPGAEEDVSELVCDGVFKHTADGWLISCEAVQMVELGIRKVLCVQPFGCMPNHICGKGMYPNLQRHYPDAHLVSVDYDTSGTLVNVENRIQMLLDAQ